MNVHTTIHSPPAIAGGIVAGLGATALLVRDGFTTGFTLDHALMPVLVGLTILAGHMFWQALREWRLLSALGFMALTTAGSTLTVYETMGRRAELRDAKVSAAQAANFVIEEKKSELGGAQSRLAEANNMVKREMTGERCGNRCQDWKVRASEVEAKIEKLTSQIALAGGEKPVDAKAERVAAIAQILMPDIAAERVKATVGMMEPFTLPLFLEFGSIVFFGYRPRRQVEAAQNVPASDSAQTSFDVSRETALPSPSMFSDERPDPPPVKRKLKTKRLNKKTLRRENVLSFAERFQRTHGHVPAFSTLRGRFHLSNGTAHRYRQEAMKRAQA